MAAPDDERPDPTAATSRLDAGSQDLDRPDEAQGPVRQNIDRVADKVKNLLRPGA